MCQERNPRYCCTQLPVNVLHSSSLFAVCPGHKFCSLTEIFIFEQMSILGFGKPEIGQAMMRLLASTVEKATL